MDYIYLKSKAKINLTLDVCGKLDNGYHELKTVMQTVNLFDSIFIKKTRKPGLKINSNLSWLPVDERNLAHKAASAIIKNYDNINTGIYIEIVKKIPVSAGLGGGSSNCAAVLVGMRKLFDLSITNNDLIEIGKSIGSDVPYCIIRGTVLAEGTGDKLTRLPPCPFCYVLLAKPSVNVSTGSIFKRLDLSTITKRPDTQSIIDAIIDSNLKKVADNLCNVLEHVTIPMYPVINDIKKIMHIFGALGTVMSGSGPTVLGLFENKQNAVKAMYHLKLQNIVREAFVTTIFNCNTNRRPSTDGQYRKY